MDTKVTPGMVLEAQEYVKRTRKMSSNFADQYLEQALKHAQSCVDEYSARRKQQKTTPKKEVAASVQDWYRIRCAEYNLRNQATAISPNVQELTIRTFLRAVNFWKPVQKLIQPSRRSSWMRRVAASCIEFSQTPGRRDFILVGEAVD